MSDLPSQESSKYKPSAKRGVLDFANDISWLFELRYWPVFHLHYLRLLEDDCLHRRHVA